MIFRAPASRVLPAVAIAGVLAISACGKSTASQSPNASTSPSIVATTPSGSASASKSASATPTVKKKTITSINEVSVTGAVGKAPTVKAPYPFLITKTANKVLTSGSGVTVTKNSIITFNYDGIDATTGKSFDSSFTKGRTPLTLPATQLIPGFTSSIIGKKVGDRVLMVINSKDGYDPNGSGDIKPGDTLIFVVDLLGASLSGPTGAAVTPPAGLPTVGKDAKGYPTLTIDTSRPAPTKVVVQPLTTGTGAVIKATDTIQVHYRGYDWKTGQKVLDDYSGEPETGVVNQLLASWQQGLTGKKVGSRVMIVAPDVYPNGNASPSVAAGSTIVFVIDVLYAYATPTQ